MFNIKNMKQHSKRIMDAQVVLKTGQNIHTIMSCPENKIKMQKSEIDSVSRGCKSPFYVADIVRPLFIRKGS